MATEQALSAAHLAGLDRDRSGLAPSQKKTAKASPWIIDRWRDLCLFVGTPVILIPLFAAAQARWSAQDIFLYVSAFGAMGHHLPGMIRAYGDRALFSRFRTRFLVAPVLLLTVSIWSSWYNVQAIQLLALSWGIWHGMMQTYGFCRIYDGKASASAAARARADFALCLSWFVAAVLLSRLRIRTLLDLYYESGGPVIPTAAFNGFRLVLIGALVVVTLFFCWQQIAHWRGKRWASPIKLTLLTSSIAFWWYCNNGVQNILVGIALFEVFHDVQYLSIVWIYNRSRVERDQTITGFMRFVFRKSGALIGVYVGLVLAYGSIAFTTWGPSATWIRHALLGVVTASALLHFYYDGFIWKVRETQTRTMLGIAGDAFADKRRRWTVPLWAQHSLRWALLVIPFGALCAVQLIGRAAPALERTAKVAEILPDDAQAQLDYGQALHGAGRVTEATDRYQAALKKDPTLAEAEFFLGLAYADVKNYDLAIEHYRRSLALYSKNESSSAPDSKYADADFNLACILRKLGQRSEAQELFTHSLTLNPEKFLAHQELGDMFYESGQYNAAIAEYQEALRLNPQFKAAEQGLHVARLLANR
ncbi:MAG TPA: tetratricopeptide repeat protein [Chthoniobacterales bacterium]|jgi:Flp pilus assembly protein TadD